MVKKSFTFLTLFLLVFSISSCKKNQKKGENESTQEIKEKPAVCIWDKGSIRTEPQKGSKWVSSMALGEKVTWLGITKVDSANNNIRYHKVRLSDSTTGWASEYVVVLDAFPGVITKEASLYKRPDLLTVSEKKFDKMDIVAITKSENEWRMVTGNQKKKKGWIKANTLSQKEDDVAVALLVKKAMDDKNKANTITNLQKIIQNPSFENSTFIGDLKEKLAKLTVKKDSTSTQNKQEPVNE